MQAYFLKMYTYEDWANLKVARLAQEPPSLPDRVSAIFSHLLAAQQVWYHRLTEQDNPPAVWSNYPISDWESLLLENGAQFRQLIQSYQEADWNRKVIYQNSKGTRFETPVHEILSHLLLHAAYHRGQLILLLKPLVKELPLIDFIFYLREQG